MDTTGTSTAIWEMLADRWRKTIKAKALSSNTERGYLYTAARWARWLAEQGYDIEPAEVRPHHVDDFIADIIEATSAANGAHHYRNLRVYFAWLVKREDAMGGRNPMDVTEPPTGPGQADPGADRRGARAVVRGLRRPGLPVGARHGDPAVVRRHRPAGVGAGQPAA